MWAVLSELHYSPNRKIKGRTKKAHTTKYNPGINKTPDKPKRLKADNNTNKTTEVSKYSI